MSMVIQHSLPYLRRFFWGGLQQGYVYTRLCV
jgi:hypothetical protein